MFKNKNKGFEITDERILVINKAIEYIKII
jgi:hypothetical protein